MELLAYLGFLVIAIIIDLGVAWVANTLWGWFVTPAFHLAAPGIMIMFGLSIMVSLYKGTNTTDFDWDQFPKMIFNRTVGVLVILLFGWLAHGLV